MSGKVDRLMQRLDALGRKLESLPETHPLVSGMAKRLGRDLVRYPRAQGSPGVSGYDMLEMADSTINTMAELHGRWNRYVRILRKMCGTLKAIVEATEGPDTGARPFLSSFLGGRSTRES
ncbi:MAG TPA: hypothetical protein VMY37_34805 [Thermoguttaceae bacterium]|nr:hypothetical protein [Thermoguttaceae bacterium]